MFFEKAEELDPNNFLALKELGEIYWNDKMYEEGQLYFEKCLSIDKSDETTVVGCVCCKKRGEKEENMKVKRLEELENYLVDCLG